MKSAHIYYYLFTIYYVSITALVLFVRPSYLLLPTYWLYIFFSLLPSLASFLICMFIRPKSTYKKPLVLVLAFYAYLLVFRLQLTLLVEFALNQPDGHLEGLISNFYVTAYDVFTPPYYIVIVFCGAIILFNNKIHKFKNA